jgi:hypothetical protein
VSIVDRPYDESYPPSLWLGPDPQITTLTPNTGSAAAGPITVTVTGTDFDASSVVEIQQVAQPTTYVSATQLTVSYDPTAAGTVMFTVRRGSQESNSVPFVATALDVGTMSVADVRAWVDDHPEEADEVLAEEQAREHPRVTLIDWLQGFIAHRDDDEADDIEDTEA